MAILIGAWKRDGLLKGLQLALCGSEAESEAHCTLAKVGKGVFVQGCFSTYFCVSLAEQDIFVKAPKEALNMAKKFNSEKMY